MSGFGVLVLLCVCLYFACKWLLAELLTWLIKKIFHIDVRIGQVGFFYFNLKDVVFYKNGFTVHIDKISFRSSFLSSEVAKLLSVVVHDVRINKDVRSRRDRTPQPWQPPPSFHDQRIPPIVITFAQFMAVDIHSVTGVFLWTESPEWLLHITLADLHIDGSVLHSSRSLLVNVTVGSSSAKLLRHAADACLAELSVALTAEATFVAQGPMSLENLYVGLEHTKAVINDGFYTFAQERDRTSTVSNKPDFNIIIQRLAPIIPKLLTLKLEDALLQDLATLSCFEVTTRFNPAVPPDSWPQLSVDLNVIGLKVSRDTCKVLTLQKLNLDVRVTKKLLNVNFSLNTLLVSYDHDEVYSWLLAHLHQPQSLQEVESEEKTSDWKWLQDMELQVEMELFNVTTMLRLSQATLDAVSGFKHLKVVCTYDPSLINTEGHLYTAELLIDSAWCRLSSSLDVPPGKSHIWGTPFYLGVMLVKLRCPISGPARLQWMLDIVRTEWSPPLAAFLAHAVACVKDYQSLRGVRQSSKSSSTRKLLVDTTITITHSNMFFIADKKVCIVMRLDKTSVDIRQVKVSVTLEGAKVMSVSPTKAQYTCVRSEEIKAACGHVKVARAEWHRQDNTWLLELTQEVDSVWSPNLHLKLLTLFKEMKALRNTLTTPETESPVENTVQDFSPKKLLLKVKARLRCNLILSSKHNLTFTTDDIMYSYTGDNCQLETSMLKIAIDGATIFTFESLQVKKLHSSEVVKVERANSDGFVLAWNNTWGVSIKSLKIIFPYEHNFTEAVQKEFISIVKWLRLLHPKQSSEASKPLPSDLVIKLKEFVFEMSDDPFEVRLRDNYELLEDEYKEILKRQKMLDAKVADMCKTRRLLPAGKVEELYQNFNKLNSQIYLQRSRQMKQAGTRTRLFAWIMSEVEIIALADPSIHGTENVVKVMTEIDCDTPWPEEGVEFSTLWCRSVIASCVEWKFQLRDFPQPWLDIGQLHMWGRLVGAEQMATRRSKREVVIELGEPWGQVEVERSMTSLKFYHDLNCEVEHFSYAFGPCWEPVIAQCNLSFEKISRPSLDPSPPLSFWDKMRLLIHGQLTMEIRQLTVLLHASLDPYNTTEEMEVTWSNVVMDWTNAKVVFKGDFDIWVRTASKYDDCRLLHLPNLKLSIKLSWVCLGNPNDHHSVMPCAPDKLPEYSSNQVHDSYRAFRSQNLNVSLALETKPGSNVDASELDCPLALLYGSTLRWFENLKLILSGVTRPTRRGTAFHNLRPRKIPLSRHYRTIHLSIALHRFHIHYWMSFAMQRGLELTGQRISSSSEHTLTLVPVDDCLKHRPRPEWAIVYMTCELNDAEVWLKSALPEESGKETLSLRQPVEKCYCLSVGKVSYGREASPLGVKGLCLTEGNPTHRLVVHHLKGAWTMSNREVAFALFDSFMKTKQLKKNLSTEALKGFRGDTTSTPLKSRNRNTGGQVTPPAPPPPAPPIQATPSPMTKLQSGQAATMLQQLIAEAENKNVVFSDDLSTQTREQQLQGLGACHEDDVVHKNWLIALVNSQVLLKGIETKGYVILSAAKAEVLQRVHRPVWKDRTLVSKTTWVGSLECMQYYATVSAGENDSLDENIMWLNVENIQEKEGTFITDLPDLPHLVGSGQSVGGVISETVGGSSTGENSSLQLQRIVSRCKCEFFYAGYGESSMDPHNLAEVPPVPLEEPSGPWERRETAVDAFTLMHHDLDVCTNSLQYAMILDIVNNLLLYVPPRRKEAFERLQRMRFQLQLHSVQDQHRPIQQLQNHVRSLVSKLRKLEKDTYLVQRALTDEPGSEHLLTEMEDLEQQVYDCKEQLQSRSDELDMMLSCYKETQLSTSQKLATTRRDKPVTMVRANEICFKHAQWRLTDADGQLGIADIVLSNFLYTKNSKSDDSVEHLLEVGYVRMTNLLPNQVYKEVLVPTEIQSNMPVDRKRAVRVFCREKAPVGGISVKEHFEINVVPVTIGLTKKFYNTMLKFFFPERDPENIEGDGIEEADSGSTSSKKSKSNEKSVKKGKDSNFYVRIEQKDDVEKMKERAEKNKLFIYIKIPEVPMKVSYKGNKEKNLEDIQDVSLVIPTLEYHNVTWTWLDLLLAMKNDSRRVILPQAIKQKFQIKVKRGASSEGPSPQEEDKARILLGSKLMPQESRGQKKGVFKLQN